MTEGPETTTGINSLYSARSEYVTAGLLAIILILNVLIWIQVFSNFRRDGVFNEQQFLVALTMTAIVTSVATGVFLGRWIRGRP